MNQHLFQLCPYPPPASTSRTAVLQRLIEKPVWNRNDVARLEKIVDLTMESRHDFPPEWLEMMEKAGGLVEEWQKVDSLVPENGSLKRALTRPRKRERAKRLYEKIRKHQEWYVGHVKRRIGYKEYKTQAARRKQWAKLEGALANDRRKKQLDDLAEALYNASKRG